MFVEGGVIARIGAYDEPASDVVDLGRLVLAPGLVDTHVHVNEPGRTAWEGFATSTRAAAAGGVTTIVDMPLNSIPPTTSVAGLLAKAQAAEGKCHVDVGLCGGLVPGNAGELRAIRDAGALAFKCFLAPSGVDEFPHCEADDLAAGMRALADVGAPLLVHAELPGPLRDPSGPPRSYRTWLDARPPAAEEEAVARVLALVEETRARAHVVHLSAASALGLFVRARERALPLSVETCPHYLHFAAERIADGAVAFKCAPPIRGEANRAALWDALRQGLIDQVVTDHSPASPDVKCADSGDFARAWGGIASLQIGLPAVWSEARTRGVAFDTVVRWMSESPARLVGLWGRKGAIAPGFDADFAAWDPDAPMVVDRLFHRHPMTPYLGESLYGRVHATWLRGRKVFENGAHVGAPEGRWLRG
ncbi:MAG: allantoinase AllB [Myxococcota bacterium]